MSSGMSETRVLKPNSSNNLIGFILPIPIGGQTTHSKAQQITPNATVSYWLPMPNLQSSSINCSTGDTTS
ncbi:unnamed protein product [Coffea canephora]|uniref:Uncharacterized protein n=1 Tax=Coffea canephora TaxID=49390 RepID=A0A068TPW9_COFCA|nr:unnamed protein product [Coffea canephora]